MIFQALEVKLHWFGLIVEPAYVEQDIVVTTTLRFTCLHLSVHPLGLCRTTTSIFMDGLQIDLAQLISLMSRFAILKFHSGRSKVKVIQAELVVP